MSFFSRNPDGKPPLEQRHLAEHAHQHRSFLASDQLLLGVVALQNNLITREQFLAGFDLWIQAKNRRLSEILESQKAIESDDRELLERLVSKFLAKHGGDVEKSLAAVSSVPDVTMDLERLGDPELQTSLVSIGRSRSPADDLATMLLPPADSSTRFRILRPHAKGGLGQVSVALDRELNREVALKEILPQHLDRVSRERFILEAEITGALEHPGIVPVYALGHTSDGRPYYAMRFIKGDSLKQALELYHNPNNPGRNHAGARHLALRQLLRRFIDVCNAIEYAHSRGVLHRDLKPGNIMVGQYGETLVVDWGLAKAIGKKEILSDEATLRPSNPLSSSGQTQPGSAIGTPSYMSPEQAEGRLDDLGPATDVYSLGATLYHVLTGSPPFKGSTVDVILRVREGAFSRPRDVAPEIPTALEAICLKAMHRKAEDRYQSAREISDDVEHWLADEPVSAAPDTLSIRLSRWGRRHKGLVQATATSLIILTLIAISAAFWINAERQMATKERDQAEQERERADKKAAEVQRQIARMYTERGLVAVEQGMYSEAVAWFASSVFTNEVAATEPGQTDRMNRIRLANFIPSIPRLHTVLSHPSEVTKVDFSPDGRFVLTMDVDDNCRAWRIAPSTREVTLVREWSDSVFASFVSEGSEVIIVNHSGLLRRYDTATGNTVGKEISKAGVLPILSPKGRYVITVSEDNAKRRFKCYDVRTGEPVGDHLEGIEKLYPTKFNFSPDERLVFLTGRHKSDCLWEIPTLKLIGDRLLPNDIDPQSGNGHFSPDGNLLVCNSFRHSPTLLTLYNSKTGERVVGPVESPLPVSPENMNFVFSPNGQRVLLSVLTSGYFQSSRYESVLLDAKTLEPCGEAFKSLLQAPLFDPSSARLLFVSDERTVKMVDTSTGLSFGEPLIHPSEVTSLAFAPDGRWIIASTGAKMLIWESDTGKLISQFHKRGTNSVVSPDGLWVAFPDEGGLELWDAMAGHRVDRGASESWTIKTNRITDATISENGQRLVTGCWDGHGQVWDTATGQAVGTGFSHNGPIARVAINADGSRVATASWDLTARLWNAKTGKPLSDPLPHLVPVTCVVFSPDGRWIASTAGSDGQIWDAATGQPVGERFSHNAGIYHCVFSPDSKHLMTASHDGIAGIWNVPGGRRDDTMPNGGILRHGKQSEPVVHVAWNIDGKSVVTTGTSGTARIWSVSPSVQNPPVTIQHENRVGYATFSPDGRLVATASWDSTARVWSSATGRPVGKTLRHGGVVNHIAFSPDGSLIATASLDGSARVWDSVTGDPMAPPLEQNTELNHIFFSTDGNSVYLVGQSEVTVWNVGRMAVGPGDTIVQSVERLTAIRSDAGFLQTLSTSDWTTVNNTLGKTDRNSVECSLAARRSALFRNRGLEIQRVDAKAAEVYDKIASAQHPDDRRSFVEDSARTANPVADDDSALSGLYGLEKSIRMLEGAWHSPWPKDGQSIASWTNDKTPFDIEEVFSPREFNRTKSAEVILLMSTLTTEIRDLFFDPIPERRNSSSIDKPIENLLKRARVLLNKRDHGQKWSSEEQTEADEILNKVEPFLADFHRLMLVDDLVLVTGLRVDSSLALYQGMRSVALLLMLKLVRSVEYGDINTSIDCIEEILRGARRIERRGMLISQLVSISLQNQAALERLNFVLGSPQLNKEHCHRLLELFRQHETKEFDGFAEAVKTEYVLFRNCLQSVATGELTLRELFDAELQELPPAIDASEIDKSIEFFNRTYKILEPFFGRPSSITYEAAKAYDKAIAELARSNDSLFRQFIRFGPFMNAFVRANTTRNGALAKIAVMDWCLSHNEPPSSLSDACRDAGLEQIPVDCFSDGNQPLLYRLIDGKPVIYSVGVDQKDDGGTVEWNLDFDKPNGDIIFTLPNISSGDASNPDSSPRKE